MRKPAEKPQDGKKGIITAKKGVRLTSKPTGANSGIVAGNRVICAFDRMLEINRLKPNPANPNRHPQKQV
jgi:hypothetical protein